MILACVIHLFKWFGFMYNKKQKNKKTQKTQKAQKTAVCKTFQKSLKRRRKTFR